MTQQDPYWRIVWKQFLHHRLGVFGLIVVILFILTGIYAPFLASSKPFILYYDGQWYFPLFRYLFYSGFYTKRLDIFFNLLIFTFPCLCAALFFGEKNKITLSVVVIFIQIFLFIYLIYNPIK